MTGPNSNPPQPFSPNGGGSNNRGNPIPQDEGVSIDPALQRLLQQLPVADPSSELCRRTMNRIREAREQRNIGGL